MKIDSRAFGKIEVDEKQIIEFPQGILGFGHLHKYALLDGENAFYFLQSLEDRQIAFPIVEPSFFCSDFKLNVGSDELEAIDLDKDSEMLVFAIVTIPEDYQKMTANLQGPIVINKKSRKARQCISINDKWKVKHYIMEELAKKQGRPC